MVTYHPSFAMIENLQRILPQVQSLVMVDNGSTGDELEGLRTASRDRGFSLIENGKNLGIAEALNQGVGWAKNNGYPWVLLLDQDVAAGERVEREPLDADVADRRPELHRLHVGPVQRGAAGIREHVYLANPLLHQDEASSPDVGDPLGVVELGALRARARRERHRVDQLARLGYLDDEVPPSPTTKSVPVFQS